MNALIQSLKNLARQGIEVTVEETEDGCLYTLPNGKTMTAGELVNYVPPEMRRRLMRLVKA